MMIVNVMMVIIEIGESDNEADKKNDEEKACKKKVMSGEN